MLSQPNDLEPVLKDASVLPSPPDPLALKSPSSTSTDQKTISISSLLYSQGFCLGTLCEFYKVISDNILVGEPDFNRKRERVGGESCNEKVPPENVTLVRIHSDATISTALSVSDATQCDFIDAEPATSASYGQCTVDKEVRTSGASPPPPPPPPPPPGILAQPSKSASSPMSPSCTARSDEIYPKKKKTYTLLWQAVSQHSITNVHTVWNEYSRPEFGVEERDHVQLLFERAEPSALSRFATERRSVRERTTAESIFQLPQQKALNLEIILAKLRPLTVMDLIERLESNNVDGIAIDLLSSLLKYFPTDEEMLLFKKAAREEVKRNCDVLCWEAARRSTLKMRTELAIAREQILQDLSRHAQSIQKIRDVCSALRSRVLIHLMHKCLQYGNYINQGTALSRAVGFSLSSLTSILSAKGKQNSSTNLRLVDLLAQYVEFETVALEDAISRLSLARSITLVDIENASRELTSSVKRLKQQLESRADGDASLLEAYQPFLEVAESSCSNLESDLREIRSTEGSLQSFLCANSMKLEEIVSVTYEALTMLSDSIKKRAMVKMRSTSVISNRQLAGRERFAMQRRSLQPTRLSVDEMRQMFLEAANQ
ncbi:FH2 domain-containing protein [Trichostrongylus colubriformis]|uniref:FH2 domain-containing protein n=1 Tax=Trichostrongylus colubriformis TaxID=6319 RepID=A0AAN8I9Z7_TRICO